MQESLSIKIDYQKGRKNPEEIFEAMALYISFYKNLGQIIAESINSKYQVALLHKSNLRRVTPTPSRGYATAAV
ncbi:hypothetical protein [Comamonas aquatica]|uniref:hypothetical protein n=1 Tax=Comamonas aquatica TaxID=225991 RepID=UPI0031D5FD44